MRQLNPKHDRILDLWADGYCWSEIVSMVSGTSKSMVNAVIWDWRKLGDKRAASRPKIICPTPITREFILSIFSYDAEKGELRWLRTNGSGRRGELAGYVHEGYRRLKVGGRFFFLHNVVWLIETGDLLVAKIDHRDGDGGNNRLSNLRLATPSQNAINQRLRSDNKTGFKGVHFRKAAGMNSKRYYSWITKDHKRFYLGDFWTAQDAADAYAKAAKTLHGEFARSA